jgi:hypothetical protein
MKKCTHRAMPVIALALLLSGAACGPPEEPEIVAISYIRATTGGDPDTAVRLLDIERITERVEEQIVVIDSSGRESFLQDSIETLLWGLFRETRPEEFAYGAIPAERDGDTARVTVTKTGADGETSEVIVHLRNTDAGWRVSGPSLDPLVTFVVQRLQEKY